MKLAVLIVLLCLSQAHLLTRIEQDLKEAHDVFKSGDGSGAFSRLMVVKLQLDELHRSLEMPEHKTEETNQNCTSLLHSIMTAVMHPEWLKNFQKLQEKLNQMASKCTNSDFTTKQSLKNLEGFNDHCAICVVISRVLENYLVYNRKNVTNFISHELCQLFNGTMKPTCQAFVATAGPIIITTLVNKEPSDKACLKLGMCKNPNCTILNDTMMKMGIENIQEIQKIPSWQWLRHLLVDRFGNGHLPPFDFDNDSFSDVGTFRGFNWKGTDCDELNKNIYPGRKDGNKFIDHDCNGIFGKAPDGKTYEDIFCQTGKRFGVAVIGDSAGAHFSIPQKYLNASMIEKGTYHDFLYRVADELDLPQESAYTGHTQTDYLSHSVYKFVREWNLCNNNDFQNIGVNGGKSGNTWDNIKALKRDNKNDHPLLMFMELIGNDVCQKSLDSMTTVERFHDNIMRLLRWLDQTVPPGSLLVTLGLGDGQVLFDNLAEEKHPLNITYSTLYQFLNCLKISPCETWLNNNATIRHLTTVRAKQLSLVYKKIIDTEKFENFKMVYYDFPTMDILERRIKEGGDPKLMIERCDGFHPNGLFMSYLADWLWHKLRIEHSDWLGSQNPHNAEIRKKFNMTFFVDPKKPEIVADI